MESPIYQRIRLFIKSKHFTISELANHVPIEYIQKMLGHKKITSTLIYAKVQDYMVQEQADNLSKLAL